MIFRHLEKSNINTISWQKIPKILLKICLDEFPHEKMYSNSERKQNIFSLLVSLDMRILIIYFKLICFIRVYSSFMSIFHSVPWCSRLKTKPNFEFSANFTKTFLTIDKILIAAFQFFHVSSPRSAMIKRKVIRMVGFLIMSFLICRFPFFCWYVSQGME